MLLGTSQSPDTTPHQASPHALPIADTTENFTLGGRDEWHGGNGTDYVSPHLLFKRNLLFWSNLCQKKRPTDSQGIPEVPFVPQVSAEVVLSPLVEMVKVGGT